MAIRPTFCENDVTGGHPNKEEIEDAKPSHAKEPEISRSVISLFNPVATIAEVSPIVSAADTRKIIAVEMIAPTLNSGLYGRSFGSAINPSAKIIVRSTFPKKIATIYPTIKPASTESWRIYPFAKIFHPRHVSKVTPAMIRF